MIIEGGPAPEFRLCGSDGNEHSLSDYRGKTVVIYFYPRDNTSGCTKEACGFRDNHALLEGLNAVVLGISKDSLKSHDKFIRDFSLPFTLLSDPDLEVMKAYGAYGEKSMYGKTVEGSIRSTVIVSSAGTVLKHWKKVARAETHPQDVVMFIEGLVPCNSYSFAANPSKSPLDRGDFKASPLSRGDWGVGFRCSSVLDR